MPKDKGYKILSFRDKHGGAYCINAEGNYSCTFNGSRQSFFFDELLQYLNDFIEIFSVQRIGDGKIFILNSVPYHQGKVTDIDIDLVNLTICISIEYPSAICRVFIPK